MTEAQEQPAQPRDDTGLSHAQTVLVTELTPVQRAFQNILDHTTGRNGSPGCCECRSGGMDCTIAARLRQAWRKAKVSAA
ncbi:MULTISPECIES: hypothetical protein [unclassified Streptomyces]|uniref:hypothetical protein n=1 Tax=unclassified Streptomyces TaxID=2593676 RepID=UPI002E135898|nr:hypothetical protein OG452_32960 [Streptomyces sp. NBC_01197]WSS47492.1 hypothetical protein OG708_01885 [Streptomyces sp. NBC_01180]